MMNVQAAENQTESFHATVLESESLTYDILDENKEPFELRYGIFSCFHVP